jgi:hypothetical protein
MHPGAKTALFHNVCGGLIRRKWDYLQEYSSLNMIKKKETGSRSTLAPAPMKFPHFQVRAKTAGRGPASCAAINCTHPGPRCGKILHLSLILAGSLASPLLHDYHHSRSPVRNAAAQNFTLPPSPPLPLLGTSRPLLKSRGKGEQLSVQPKKRFPFHLPLSPTSSISPFPTSRGCFLDPRFGCPGSGKIGYLFV